MRHTFDIHCPYNPPEPYASLFQSPGAEAIDPSRCAESFMKAGLTAAQALYLSDRYDGSIRRVDDVLGNLFRFLEERGDLQNTVVVITSDHGEEFFEHGRVGHRRSLHRELLEVPFLIAAPGVSAQRVPQLVSQVDLLPTVLDLMEIPAPEALDGRSLVPALRGLSGKGVFKERSFEFSERHYQGTLQSRFDNDHHLIETTVGEKVKLYSVPEDPQEKNNLVLTHPDVVSQKGSELRSLIRDLELEHDRVGSAEAVVQPNSQEIERLRSLGYLR